VGVEPNHTTARKPRPLKIIQYSLRYVRYIPEVFVARPVYLHHNISIPAHKSISVYVKVKRYLNYENTAGLGAPD
jgi:hypothetical protein